MQDICYTQIFSPYRNGKLKIKLKCVMLRFHATTGPGRTMEQKTKDTVTDLSYSRLASWEVELVSSRASGLNIFSKNRIQFHLIERNVQGFDPEFFQAVISSQ